MFMNRTTSPAASGGCRATGSDDEHARPVDRVIARVAARLRPIRGPLRPAELDALAQDIVLDVARFVLEWTEHGQPPPRAGAP